MPKNIHKKTDTKVKDPKFIRFSELQRKYITDVRNRVQGELNAALDVVYKDLDILEKMRKAPPGMYQVRMHDCSGVDIFPPPPAQDPPVDPPQPDPPEEPPVENPKDIKPPEKD